MPKKKQPTIDDLINEQSRLAEECLRNAKEVFSKVEEMYQKRPLQQASPKQEVSFDYLQSLGFSVFRYENETLHMGLTVKRIKMIPVRDAEWFDRRNAISLAAFSLNGKELIVVSSILPIRSEILFQLQAKGYRFIEGTTEAYFAAAKDCHQCRFANKCPEAVRTTKYCPAIESKKDKLNLSFSLPAWQDLLEIKCEN